MIQAEHLQKTFRVRKTKTQAFKKTPQKCIFSAASTKKIHALNDVSFRIEDGEAVGYIGPNGAEKAAPSKFSPAF